MILNQNYNCTYLLEVSKLEDLLANKHIKIRNGNSISGVVTYIASHVFRKRKI